MITMSIFRVCRVEQGDRFRALRRSVSPYRESKEIRGERKKKKEEPALKATRLSLVRTLPWTRSLRWSRVIFINVFFRPPSRAPASRVSRARPRFVDHRRKAPEASNFNGFPTWITLPRGRQRYDPTSMSNKLTILLYLKYNILSVFRKYMIYIW